MACDSQSFFGQVERSRIDALAAAHSPEAQTMDTSQTMSAIIQAAAVLHSPLPASTCLATSQQFAPTSFNFGANQPVGFNVSANPPVNYSMVSANPAPFAMKSAQNSSPFMNYAPSPVGTPSLPFSQLAAGPVTQQAAVTSGGSMLSLLGSPQTRCALNGNGSEPTSAATHYAALLPKPVGYSRKQYCASKYTQASTNNQISQSAIESPVPTRMDERGQSARGGRGRSSESARQRSAASSALRGHKRTIVCKRFAPLPIQPQPFAAPRIAPLTGNANANLGVALGSGGAGNFGSSTPNTLTAFLTPGTNTLHILPIGAIQQLAQLQQAMVGADRSTLINAAVVAGGGSVTTSVPCSVNAPPVAVTLQLPVNASGIQQQPTTVGLSVAANDASSQHAESDKLTNIATPSAAVRDECDGAPNVVEPLQHDDSTKNEREKRSSQASEQQAGAPAVAKNRKSHSKAVPNHKVVRAQTRMPAKVRRDSETSGATHASDSTDTSASSLQMRRGRRRQQNSASPGACSKQPLQLTIITTDKRNLSTATSAVEADPAACAPKRRGRLLRGTDVAESSSQSNARTDDTQAKHVVDGYVISELSNERSGHPSAVQNSDCNTSAERETPCLHAQPQNTGQTVPISCVVCACTTDMRLEADDPDATRRVRRLIELRVCSYRCKQKFLSRREKLKRQSLERRNCSSADADGGDYGNDEHEQQPRGKTKATNCKKPDTTKSKATSVASKQLRTATAKAKNRQQRLSKTAHIKAEVESEAENVSQRSNDEFNSIGGTSRSMTPLADKRQTPDLIANIRHATATVSSGASEQEPSTRRRSSRICSSPKKPPVSGPSSGMKSTKRDAKSHEKKRPAVANTKTELEAVPRRTRATAESQAQQEQAPEPNLPRTRSQSRRATTVAAATPAKLKSPPVALVSPSNSLLTPTSLSELSSSAFSLTSPPVQPRTDEVESKLTKHCTDPAKWNVEQVYEFLRSRDWLAEYAAHFRAAEIDGRALALLHVDHLVGTLRMKLGPALKLHDLVHRLKTNAAFDAAHSPTFSVVAQQCNSEDELNVEDF